MVDRSPLRTARQLAAKTLIAKNAIDDIERLAKRYAIAITPAAEGMIGNAPEGPIGLQFVPDMAELLRYLRGADNAMAQSVLHRLEREERRLKMLSEKRALTDPMAFVQDRRLQLDYLQDKMTAAARTHWTGRPAALRGPWPSWTP